MDNEFDFASLLFDYLVEEYPGTLDRDWNFYVSEKYTNGNMSGFIIKIKYGPLKWSKTFMATKTVKGTAKRIYEEIMMANVDRRFRESVQYVF